MSNSLAFYKTAIEKLKSARFLSLDQGEQDELTGKIRQLTVDMQADGFGEIANRTAELQALVTQLETLLAGLSQPTFGSVLGDITGFIGEVRTAFGAGDDGGDAAAGDDGGDATDS